MGVTNVCLYVPSLSDIITKNAVDLGTHLNIDGTSLDSFLLVYGIPILRRLVESI